MAQNELVTKLEKNQQAIARLNKEIEKAVGAQIEKRNALEAQNTEMRQAILEAMEANNVKQFDGDLIKITYVAPSMRTTFDSKRFATAMPKTYAKFLKKGITKAYVKLQVKV